MFPDRLSPMPDSPRLYEARPREIDRPPGRDLSAELNAEQGAAASYRDGPLLIVAGAGTGKTRTLVYRVATLIEGGASAERILLLTFTRRAAHEMLSRAERLVGSASSRVHGGTFHATGHRLLRLFGSEAGLPRDFSIMDQGDAEDLMQLARGNLGYGRGEKRFPKKESLHYIYSRHINVERPIEDILHEEYPQFRDFSQDIISIFAEYVSRKSERNLVDYDDLLLFWALMLEQSESLAERISALYDHILVDEYQDTNLLQARILRGMCRHHRNVTVVGDDAHSIYSFRGASFRNILDFPQQFDGAHVVTLEQNYRSTQPILDTTNTLISRAAERFTKNLWTNRAGGERPWLVTTRDEQQQTRFVVDRILELHEEGIPLREMAVLIRAAYMSADLEIELANRNIPFEKWGGIKFLEAAHVKDVLAFLRVLDNPRDEVSWYRILMLMPGIGDVTARAILASMAEQSWGLDAFASYTPPARAVDAHKSLARLLRVLSAPRSTKSESERVGEDIDEIRRLYDSILAERYDHSEPRLADLDQLRVIASGYPSRAAFLAAVALEPPQSTQDLADGSDTEEDALVISTVHSSKGKEWDAVFVIWAVDGWFPLSRSLGDGDEMEEERRLMYVAMTRARNHLAVTYPLNVYATRRGQDYSIDQLSRFIDRGVRDRMQRVVPRESGNHPDGGAPAPLLAPPSSAPIDLRALLKGRFSGPTGSG
jgi:DNA helicase-2/ATP-dependent DNA helicase PcrA